MGYACIEPFGYEIQNLRMGIVASTVANVAPRGRGARVLKPADFFPTTRANKALTRRQQQQLAERGLRGKRGT